MPDSKNDRENAENYIRYYHTAEFQELKNSKLHLTLSTASPNLQEPEEIIANLTKLVMDFPTAVFGWAGEINVFKHSLVDNGFLNDFSNISSIAKFFEYAESEKWPITIHLDLGNIPFFILQSILLILISTWH